MNTKPKAEMGRGSWTGARRSTLDAGLLLSAFSFLLSAFALCGQGFEFGGYQVISSARVGRTEFEYVMRVAITNKVAAAQGISAQVFSRSADTVIVEGDVSFGDLGFGAGAISADTITLRQNRLAAFNPTNLQWFVSVQAMALAVTVNAPASGMLTNGTSVLVSGTVGPGVDGVRVGGVLAALTGTNFTAIQTLEEGRNTISILATNTYGGVGLANIIVNRDTTAPILSIDTPSAGAVSASRQVTVTGQINDIVPGTVNPEQASVMVNGLPATIVNRSYAITDLLLAPGKNVITAVARDRAGNESQRQIEVTLQDPASQKRLLALAGDRQTGMIGTVLPEALVVELVDGNGVVQTNQPVTFTVSRNDGTLLATPNSGRSLTVLTSEKGQAGVLFQLGTRTGVGNNEVSVTSPGVAVPLLISANATGTPPARVAALIPETQTGQVGMPLPLPWTAFVTDAGGNPVAGAPITFSISQGGGNLGGAATVVTNTDGDGRAFVIHTLGPAAGVNDNVVTATVAGVTNSAAVFTASGQTAGALNQTRIVGVVLDNANRPMSNILCRVENTLLVTVTDPQGQFVISNAPVGSVRLNVDGRNRGYPGEWHTLQFDLVTVAGQDNRLDRPIYMLPLDAANSAIAGGATDVTLQLAGVPGSSLTILAHSLRDPNNQPITNQVMWTQVNLERVPMAPPIGSQFTLAWTVQPINLRFNPPARVCVPNKGLAPGQVVEMFGFDHDINAFVSLGQGTVTPDGSQICSNPGFGITKSGWGGAVPPPPPCTPVCGPDPTNTDCVTYEKIPPATKCDCPTFKPKNAAVTKVEPKVEGTNEYTACVNEELHFTSTVEYTNCTGLKYLWEFGDGQTNNTPNPTHTYTNPGSGSYTVKLTVSCEKCESAKKDATVKVNFVSMSSINVALPSTKDAVTGVAPADGTFTSANTDTNFAGAASGDLMVILQNCGTNGLTATGVMPATATNKIRWQIDKDPADGVAAGTPGLAPLSGGTTVLTPSAPGNFRVVAYCDGNKNSSWDPGEELRILRLVVVRITIQTNHNISVVSTFNGGANAVSTVNPMSIRADFLLEGGAANGRLGISRITLGNVGNCVGDTFTINYPVPAPAPPPPGNVAGTGAEDPDGRLNTAAGFPNPMLDSVNVVQGGTATGGTSPFRGNSVPSVLGNGPGGIGELRRINSLDQPAFGWAGSHPTTGNPWRSTQGANLFREWMVAFSTDFNRNYVVMGGADWTVTVLGTNNAANWNNNGSTVTIPGAAGNSSPFTTVFSPARNADGSGAQMLGPSFVREYRVIYTP